MYNYMKVNNVDIVCGLAWGDEAKGKITSQLAKTNNYDFVCRWSGGDNAGHTIYMNDTIENKMLDMLQNIRSEIIIEEINS